MRIHAQDRTRRLRWLAAGGVMGSALWLFAGTALPAAQAPAKGEKQAVVTVKGLQCPFCAYGIQKQLKKLKGVTSVEVELEKNQAIVTVGPDAKVTDADIEQAVRKAGFTPGKIEWTTGAKPDKDKATDELRTAERLRTFPPELTTSGSRAG